MSNFLSQLLGMEQPAAVPPPAPRTYSPRMERLARARGFKSASQMASWHNQRNRPTGGTIPRGGAAPGLDTAMMWHPKNIFEAILGKWKDAAGD